MKIKYISSIITAITMLYASSAIASDKDSDLAICSGMEKVAHIVMTARQNGMSIVDVIKLSEKRMAGTDSAQYIPIVEQMAHIAYGQRKYSSESYQQEAITEFGNTMYIACKQARGGQ